VLYALFPLTGAVSTRSALLLVSLLPLDELGRDQALGGPPAPLLLDLGLEEHFIRKHLFEQLAAFAELAEWSADLDVEGTKIKN